MSADVMARAAVVENANRLLSALVERSQRDYEAVMKETLTDKEYEQNSKRLDEVLQKLEIKRPVGAFAGGTGHAKEVAELDGENGQEAIQLLKSEGRLQQCGRGRGKCLIVLDKTPLGDDTAPPAADVQSRGVRERPAVGGIRAEAEAGADAVGEEAPAALNEGEVEMIRADDLPGMLRAIREAMRGKNRELEDCSRERAAAVAERDEYAGMVEARDETIRTLEARLDEMAATTWQ